MTPQMSFFPPAELQGAWRLQKEVKMVICEGQRKQAAVRHTIDTEHFKDKKKKRQNVMVFNVMSLCAGRQMLFSHKRGELRPKKFSVEFSCIRENMIFVICS